MSSLRRNLVFCCDGTGNDPSAPTNVKLFKDAVMRASRATEQRPAQAVHYEKGVGTRAFEEISGNIAGTGREKRIKAGYSFLRARYAMPGWRPDQNRVFLLGFSRGAYIVRRLSGMLGFSGLARNAKDEARAWDIYENRDARGAAKLRREGRCFDIDVEMVGVWDTVKATVDADFDDHELAGNVTAGYHAMAIDEQRKPFPVLRWNREEKRVLEVWRGASPLYPQQLIDWNQTGAVRCAETPDLAPVTRGPDPRSRQVEDLPGIVHGHEGCRFILVHLASSRTTRYW